MELLCQHLQKTHQVHHLIQPVHHLYCGTNMSLKHEIIDGIMEMEEDLEHPTFSWNSGTYNCVPSISEFQRTLESGGFTIDKLLTMTVLLIYKHNNLTFPGDVRPDTQQTIMYQGEKYRII